ncbi:hypothetical protein EJB05_55208, partial [Eragrostis curvula]
MEQWRMRCLSGGGESKASSSMENKVFRPFLCLVMVFYGHSCGLVRVWFPVTSFWMLVRFVFSHDESGEGGDNGVSDGLDGDNFIVFTCGRSEFSSVAYLFGMMILDGRIYGSFK